MKRAFDMAVVVVTAVVWLPLLLALSAVVWAVMGRPVFFRQRRPGKDGRLFTLVKFRTMLEGAGSDPERLTRLGRFLRFSSLDELPELINVIKGEMSLVGPRPLLPQYLERYTPEQSRRHEVRPGVTGWAQVNGRNTLSWEEKFKLDVWYVDNRSFWLDIKILLMTVWRVLRRQGICAEGHESVPEFMGGAEVGGQRSEVGGQMAEVGGQRAEVGGQRAEVGGRV